MYCSRLFVTLHKNSRAMNVFGIDGRRAAVTGCGRRLYVLAGMLMCMISTMTAQDLDAKYATDLLPVGTKAPDLIDPNDSIHRIDDFHGRCVVDSGFSFTESQLFTSSLQYVSKAFSMSTLGWLSNSGSSLRAPPQEGMV